MRNALTTICLLCVLGFALAASGCTHLSVNHLEQEPWVLDKNLAMDMGFWTFKYRVTPMKDRFGVKGTAYLKKDAVPVWAHWVDDLWLATYLSDAGGKVLAKDIRVFVPRPLDLDQGIDFEFILRPEMVQSGPLFISFGYRMVLTESREGGSHMPFFASEGALSR